MFLSHHQLLLLILKDWDAGQFLAVQWRTESFVGDISECYQEVMFSLALVCVGVVVVSASIIASSVDIS